MINPGNPTGQLLTKADIQEIIKVCETEGLLLLADEVYQENVYDDGQKFIAFKQVVAEMGSQVEVASFHSVSKGFQGECGMRGGYMELHNFAPEAIEAVYKCVSVGLCSNLPGQVCVDLMVNPPQPGECCDHNSLAATVGHTPEAFLCAAQVTSPMSSMPRSAMGSSTPSASAQSCSLKASTPCLVSRATRPRVPCTR